MCLPGQAGPAAWCRRLKTWACRRRQPWRCLWVQHAQDRPSLGATVSMRSGSRAPGTHSPEATESMYTSCDPASLSGPLAAAAPAGGAGWVPFASGGSGCAAGGAAAAAAAGRSRIDLPLSAGLRGRVEGSCETWRAQGGRRRRPLLFLPRWTLPQGRQHVQAAPAQPACSGTAACRWGRAHTHTQYSPAVHTQPSPASRGRLPRSPNL